MEGYTEGYHAIYQPEIIINNKNNNIEQTLIFIIPQPDTVAKQHNKSNQPHFGDVDVLLVTIMDKVQMHTPTVIYCYI